MNNQREFKGVWIPAEIWLCKELSLIEKCLLIEIDSLSGLEKGCIASNSHFGEFLGLSPGRISQLISGLKKKEYLRTWTRYKPNSKQIQERRIYTTALFRKLKGGVEKGDLNDSEVVNKLKGGIEKIKALPLISDTPPLENDKGKYNNRSNTVRSNTLSRESDFSKDPENFSYSPEIPEESTPPSSGAPPQDLEPPPITIQEFCSLYDPEAMPTTQMEARWVQLVSQNGTIRKIAQHARAYYQSNKKQFLKEPKNYLLSEQWKTPVVNRNGAGEEKENFENLSYLQRAKQKRNGR